MIDYAEFQSAIGLDWYDIDPNLQFREVSKGIQEVDGSIPFSSTNKIKHFLRFGQHRTTRLSELSSARLPHRTRL
jgi:hypothetical protein